MNAMRKLCATIFLGCLGLSLFAQPTFPVNGVADQRESLYAFKNATIVQDAQHLIPNATLLVRKDKIVAVGSSVEVPADAIVIDCSGKFIYPSFIDLYADYGTASPQQQGGGGRGSYLNVQLNSNAKGAFGWNQAIKSDVNASAIFVVDDAKAKALREAGFGAVLTHQKDGIARGTGTFVSLANTKENFAIIKKSFCTLFF